MTGVDVVAGRSVGARWVLWAGRTAALFLLASPSFATERGCWEISQPIGGTGAGVEIALVPYVEFLNTWLDPASTVKLTVAENVIRTNQGEENLNYANLLGMSVTPFPGAPARDGDTDQTFPGLYGDTLKVHVRVPLDSEMEHYLVMGREAARYDPEITVPTAIICIKENARILWPRVRYLQVEMEGNEAYVNLGGVFSLEDVLRSPWPHDWKK
jgi:hypothetical protein